MNDIKMVVIFKMVPVSPCSCAQIGALVFINTRCGCRASMAAAIM